MGVLQVSQRNQINHQTVIEGFTRRASEEEDVRIEGRGVSIRLPFLPTLQRLLFQDQEASIFYAKRVRAFANAGVDITDFASPVAVFNFLLPSYHLRTRDVSLIETPVSLDDFEEELHASPEQPVFAFTYQTSEYLMNRQRVHLGVWIGSERCYLKMWTALGGKVIATSVVETRLGDDHELPDPLDLIVV